MKTDIDRLHAVMLGERTGRRCGKTFALCHLVAGAIEMGESEVDVVVPYHHWLVMVKPVLWDVLYEHGLNAESTWSHRVWRVGSGAKINFLVSGERELLGRHMPFVDMDDRDRIAQEKDKCR